MDVRWNNQVVGELRNDPQTARILLARATAAVGPLAAATPRDTGETAATARAEGGHRSLDRKSVAAWLIQGGASVPQQFGNSRETTPARHFNRALGL